MKTPEQMAEEYCQETYGYSAISRQDDFLAGYQAAKDEDQAKMQELEANWKFCCEDKARLLNELAAAERAKNQLADADKVMPQWISVKERLPEVEKSSFAMRKESTCVLIASNGNVHVAHLCEKWCDRAQLIFEACDCDCRGHDMEQDEWELNQVTHWMPLPEPPKEGK